MFPPVVAASTSAFKPPEGVDGSIVDVVEQIRCTGLDHLLRVLKEVEGKGGEGYVYPIPFELLRKRVELTFPSLCLFFWTTID